MENTLEYWQSRCVAAEKTVDVLKQKVLKLNGEEGASVIHRHLERSRRREERNRQRRQEIERRAAEDLATAKERMECALDGGKLAIWEWDLTGNRLAFDHRWFEIVKRKPSPNNTSPNYWRSIIHDDDLPDFLGHLEELRNGEVDAFESEFRVLTDQKDYVWVMARAQAVERDDAGQVRRLLGTVLETTDRKEAELAAQRSAAEAQALFLASIDAICCVEDGVIVECNPIAPVLFGFDSEKELLGKSVLDFSPDFQSDGSRTIDKLQSIGQEVRRNEKVRFEWTHCRPDGSCYDVDVSLFRVQNSPSNRLYSFTRDVSQRKELERQLAQAQKLESIGQLAAGVAHEINTPMQCIFSNVEYLERGLEKVFALVHGYRELKDRTDLPSSIEEIVQRAEKECRIDRIQTSIVEAVADAADGSQRVIEIVRAMKTMSHPGTADKVPTDINKLIEDASIISRNHWKMVAKLETDFDEDVGTIPLLPAQMSQVILNMLVNAADAISEKLGEEPTEIGTIRIGTRRTDDMAIIEIQDSGAGMSEAVRKRIFDPFFTTKDVGKGTGQGLAITYEVIQMHQGKIEVESEAGVGTRFRIHLPLYAENADVLPLIDEVSDYSGSLDNNTPVSG